MSLAARQLTRPTPTQYRAPRPMTHPFHADDVDVDPDARQGTDRRRRGPARGRPRAARVGRRPDRRRAPHRARAAGLRGRVAGQGPPRALLLPPRRPLRHGGAGLPPRRLRGVLDRRRADRLGRARASRSSPRTARSRTTDARRARRRRCASLDPGGAAGRRQLDVDRQFDQPVHVAGRRRRLARVRGREAGPRAGRRERPRAATPFLDIAVGHRRRRRARACSRSRSRRTTRRAGCSTSSTPRDGDSSSIEGAALGGDPNRATHRALFTVAASGETTTTAASSPSGPTGCSTSSTGDGGSQGDPGDDAQRLDSLLGKILRDRPAPRRGAGDLGARPAQPVALLVRPADGRLVIGDVGGGERGGRRRARRRAVRNYGWPRARARSPACPARDRAAGAQPAARGRLLRRDRRLRRARPGAALAARPLPVRRPTKNTLLSAALGAETSRAPSRRCRSAARRASGWTPAAASTSPRWTGRCTGSTTGRRRRARRGRPAARAGRGTTPGRAPSPAPARAAHPPPRQAARPPAAGERGLHGHAARTPLQGEARRAEPRRRPHRPPRADAGRVSASSRRAKARSRIHRVRVTVRITAVDAAGNRRVSQLRRRVRQESGEDRRRDRTGRRPSRAPHEPEGNPGGISEWLGWRSGHVSAVAADRAGVVAGLL